MELATIFVSAFLGLLIGSFLNVVAYRVPAGSPVTSPPSSCRSCGHHIRARDNIPVVSWLLLRGRCRDCGAPISVRYPLVEAGSAVLFGLTALVVGVSWVLPAYLWFVAVALVLTLTDIDHKRIPNRILYPGTIVATALLAAGAALEGAWADLWRALGGGAAYFAFLLLVALAARGGFGFGDVKLALLLGEFTAFRGWDVLAAGVFLAFIMGGTLSLALLLSRRAGRKDMIPFGPAMVLGAFLAVAIGERLVSWYLS